MIPASWDWQKKVKNGQACLQSFCFHPAPFAPQMHPCLFLYIRAHLGNQWFKIFLSCSGVSVSAGGVNGFDRIIDDRMIFWGEEVVGEGRMALAWEVSESVSASSAGPF